MSGAGANPRSLQAEVLDAMVPFIISCCSQALEEALLAKDPEQPYGIPISFLELADADVGCADALLRSPKAVLKLLDQALLMAQDRILRSHPRKAEMCPKELLTARLSGLPYAGDTSNPLLSPGVGNIRQSPGVVSCGPPKLLEQQRMYECTRCRHRFVVEVEVEMQGTLRLPGACPSGRENPCKGTAFRQVEDVQMHSDYQEVRLQESVQCLAMGSMPRSVSVILQDDLVDMCRAGDNVEMTGLVIYTWQGSLVPGQRCNVQLAVKALSLLVANEGKSRVEVEPQLEKQFEEFWEAHRQRPLQGRNKILASLCPQVYGLFNVKLATALLLIGGVAQGNVRGHLHMLLVGDPGTGKSQLMKYAARLCPRSVVTSGKGTSSAGLTVAAVRDGDQWALEAGALVLADGGLCCIDEFDGVREADRASILEAMEQQTISVAKAGLVTTLSTATSVLGVMNPKGGQDPQKGLAASTGLSTPLLSRFDIILVLKDVEHPDHDTEISGHILESHGQERDRAEASGPSGGSGAGAQSWTMETLKKYFCWVKAKFQPVLTVQAEQVLLRYYQSQRQAEQRSAERTTIRMLESLVRIAQAHARLMARPQVFLQDAIVAVTIMDLSMNHSSILGTGNALHSSFATDPDAEAARTEAQVLRLLDNVPVPSGLPHMG